MDKNDKNTGVSLFGQSEEYLVGADPIEEIFALNMGDFISEHLISEDLAKKISSNVKDKKKRLSDQLRELISIYSLNNTLCVLNFENKEDYAIYTAIAHSIVQMLEVEKCNIYLAKDYARGMDIPDFDSSIDKTTSYCCLILAVASSWSTASIIPWICSPDAETAVYL